MFPLLIDFSFLPKLLQLSFVLGDKTGGSLWFRSCCLLQLHLFLTAWHLWLAEFVVAEGHLATGAVSVGGDEAVTFGDCFREVTLPFFGLGVGLLSRLLVLTTCTRPDFPQDGLIVVPSILRLLPHLQEAGMVLRQLGLAGWEVVADQVVRPVEVAALLTELVHSSARDKRRLRTSLWA